MTYSFRCSSCNSENTSAVTIKSAWGPIARIVEYPGLAHEVTCHECGHKEINNEIAPSLQQIKARAWAVAIVSLIPVLVYVLVVL